MAENNKTLKIKKNVLGRGLGALLSNNYDSNEISNYKIFEIDLNKIKTGIYQPRIYFDKEKLEELKNSIKENGIIQPLIISKSLEKSDTDENENIYDLIAGERRYRAAEELNFKTVPAIIKDFTGSKAIEIALIENIQRQDLNVIEEAGCYKRLIEEYSLKHEELSKKIGKDRATITNILRLLSLNDNVKEKIINGNISPSHARNLIGLSDSEMNLLADKIEKEKLTVREVEDYAQKIKNKKKYITPNKHINDKNAAGIKYSANDFALYSQIKKYEEEIFENLQAKIKINYHNKNNKIKGNLEISFNSEEELEKIIKILIR